MKGNYSNRTGWERYGSCMLFCENGIVKTGLYLSPAGDAIQLYPWRLSGKAECKRCLLRDRFFVMMDWIGNEYYDYKQDRMRPLSVLKMEAQGNG